MQQPPASLETPFIHADVIETTLRNHFPAAWHRTYYFDPARNTDPDRESSVVFSLILSEVTGLAGGKARELQNFANNIAAALRTGCAQVIPFSALGRYCYLMTEHPDTDRYARLRDFFGDAALAGQSIGFLARLFEDFAARHELGHDIDFFNPAHLRTNTRAQGEKLSDALALLGLFADFGAAVFPFAIRLERAQARQSTPEHDTRATIARVIEFVSTCGPSGLTALTPPQSFALAHKLALG